MDKISTIAGLLYLSENEMVKEMAVQLLHGDITLKKAKQHNDLTELVKAAEQKQQQRIDEDILDKIRLFIEENLYEKV